jgi:3-deoxy-D-manno-octulosonate 8-phosphate phosphatase (KDO 8-P phosphatase)
MRQSPALITLRSIRLLLMDCDGVLTDGRLYFSTAGEQLKVFHVRDGQGIVAWHAAGGRSGIISGRNSPIVEMRAKELGIEFVVQGCDDKAAAVHQLADTAGVELNQVCFIGDDLPDVAVFGSVGLSAAPADAHKSARESATIVTEMKGGSGAVREVIDTLLDAGSGG